MFNDSFIQACHRHPVARTPIWLMRQAGRYMPEYRVIRERYGFLDMVKTPELATEITLQPINAFAIDAAIIFADILPILEGMGLQLTYEKGEGPVIHNPLRTLADINALREADPRESVAYTIEAVRLTKRELADKVPLIGFSGAPFTLASYAIEGGSSREYRRTKQLMYTQPKAWQKLMAHLTNQVGAYLVAQIEAGADAVQLFDSWAGILAPDDYVEYVLPYVQEIISRVRQESLLTIRQNGHGMPKRSPPIIYFGTNMSGLYPLLRRTGADVLGVDWRIRLDDAWNHIGPDIGIQGNLDPMTLFAPWPEIERRARDILDRASGRPGHIFNLGHGILTETPVEQIQQLVEFVHSYSPVQTTIQ